MSSRAGLGWIVSISADRFASHGPTGKLTQQDRADTRSRQLAEGLRVGDCEVFDDIQTFEGWDADYYPPRARRYYDRAIKYMIEILESSPDDVVLDAGCGLGDHAIRVARQGHRVHAIDISAVALDEARRRAHLAGVADKILFERGDLTDLKLKDESFDRVYSWGVVIHIPGADRALTELTRILKPGGRLALYVTNDRAWDYSILTAACFVLRRSSPDLDRSPLGRGCWYDLQGKPLWVWRFDIAALVRRLEFLGLRQTHRIAGSLTEIQRRLPRPLRHLLLWANNAWYRLRLPPGPCVTNLLVFEKPRTTTSAP